MGPSTYQKRGSSGRWEASGGDEIVCHQTLIHVEHMKTQTAQKLQCSECNGPVTVTQNCHGTCPGKFLSRWRGYSQTKEILLSSVWWSTKFTEVIYSAWVSWQLITKDHMLAWVSANQTNHWCFLTLCTTYNKFQWRLSSLQESSGCA